MDNISLKVYEIIYKIFKFIYFIYFILYLGETKLKLFKFFYDKFENKNVIIKKNNKVYK